MAPAWLEGARGWLDVAFPPSCVGCGGLVERSGYRHVCTKCAEKIDFVRGPACTTCGHPFYGAVDLETERMCPHCEGLVPQYREGRTAVLSKGTARALVHELKYHGGLHVLADIEAILRAAPGVLELVRGGTLVPVPLHPRKERERGFNQSSLLAECFVRAVDGDARIECILRRIADTRSQTAFDRKTRRTNLKNAFALAPGTAITPGHRYILVDDVFTTGSTLNSCAGVLRRAGCLNLNVVTFGHG